MTEHIALVDTSVAIPLVFVGHNSHKKTVEQLSGLTLGLCGHSAFETFSVLTRLPPPARRDAPTVLRLIAANFPESRFLGAQESAGLLKRLPDLGVAGGSVYDALVAACAVEHGLRLFTRDRRATETYRALKVELQLLD